jgi:hypothetical protein
MVEDNLRQAHLDQRFHAREARSVRRRVGHVTQSNPMREIIDVAMVGLIGGGPRLAMRAARVLLEDTYASRASARQARAHESTDSLDE